LFSVEVRDHIMIAHSFRGAMFGPAQALHGATFVVDAAFFSESLDSNGVVIDIGRAHEALKAALAPLNYRNLDDLSEFKGVNTTTEFLTKHIYDQLAKAARADKLGRVGRELKAIRVTLGESQSRGRLTRRTCGKAACFRSAWRPFHADRRLRLRPANHRRTRSLGWTIERINLGENFPWPTKDTRRHRRSTAADGA
jgi:6-pyruvoyl-tetrahydropterin synthase